MSNSETQDKTLVEPSLIWQEWAKARAKEAPSPEHVSTISKKVKINVTQLLLEERRGD